MTRYFIYIGVIFFSIISIGACDVRNKEGVFLERTGADTYQLSTEEIGVLEKLAESGNAEAAYRLSEYYQFVALDYEKNIKWLGVASEYGYVKAQSDLGCLLVLYGKTDEERKKGRYWLGVASKNGDKKAERELYRLEYKKNSLD